MRPFGVVLVVGLIVTPGCASDEFPAESLLVLQLPDKGTLDAALNGEVSIVDGCVLLQEGTTTLMRAAWPAGSSLDPVTDLLTLPSGAVLSDGDRIVGGGGSIDLALDMSDDDAVERLGTFIDLASISSFATTCRAADITTGDFYLVSPYSRGDMDDG